MPSVAMERKGDKGDPRGGMEEEKKAITENLGFLAKHRPVPSCIHVSAGNDLAPTKQLRTDQTSMRVPGGPRVHVTNSSCSLARTMCHRRNRVKGYNAFVALTRDYSPKRGKDCALVVTLQMGGARKGREFGQEGQGGRVE